MWPYLLKKLPKQTIFFGKLLGVCTFGHMLLLLLMFSAFQGYNTTYKLTVQSSLSAKHANVVLVPLYKQMPKALSNVAASAGKKNPVKKEHTTTLSAAPKVTPVVQKVAAAKPVVKKPEIKKPPVVAKKTAKPPVKEPVKVAQKPDVKKTKAIAPAPEAKPVQVAANNVVQQPKQELAQNVDTNVYVGREDYEALKMQDALQQEVARCWYPPVGIDKETVCDIAVHVNAAGCADNVHVATSSGVLVYDISARDAVEKMKFPKIAWNKQLTITFKQ